MHGPHRGATSTTRDRWLRLALLSPTALVAAVWPASAFALPMAPAPTGDPDMGFWVELLIVGIITAVAGIVMQVRRKPGA